MYRGSLAVVVKISTSLSIPQSFSVLVGELLSYASNYPNNAKRH